MSDLAIRIIECAKIDPGVVALALIDRCRALEAQNTEVREDLSVARQSLYKVVEQRNALHARNAELESAIADWEWFAATKNLSITTNRGRGFIGYDHTRGLKGYCTARDAYSVVQKLRAAREESPDRAVAKGERG